MDPIIVLEHAFSMPGPVGGISEIAVNLLQRLSFDGEGKITALKHLTEFIDICNHYRIVCESKICRLFTVTSKEEFEAGSKCYQLNPFIHGNISWRCLLMCMRIIIIKS